MSESEVFEFECPDCGGFAFRIYLEHCDESGGYVSGLVCDVCEDSEMVDVVSSRIEVAAGLIRRLN